jgi:hypothetical protein
MDKPPKFTTNEASNLERPKIVEIPRIVSGSFSNKPGEAGYISFTTNPNFLKVPELYGQVNKITTDLEIACNRRNTAGILRSNNGKVFFGVTSPAYTQFPSVNRAYPQTCITYADSGNPLAGNIFSGSKMFGDYTKEQFERNDKAEKSGETISAQAEVSKSIEVPEKLIFAVKEHLATGKPLFIQDGSSPKLEGNTILDHEPIKTLLCLYDKLPSELKEKYSLYFGPLGKIPPAAVNLFLEPLTDQEKAFYEKQGHSVTNWEDVAL